MQNRLIRPSGLDSQTSQVKSASRTAYSIATKKASEANSWKLLQKGSLRRSDFTNQRSQNPLNRLLVRWAQSA